jgi:peptidyl-prolyl cis-trans isomerase A (cyclophilin A)
MSPRPAFARHFLAALSAVLLAACATPQAREKAAGVLVDIVTSEGTITIALDTEHALRTAGFVLGLVDSGRMDGTRVYRAGRLGGRTDAPRFIEGGLLDRFVLGEVATLPASPEQGGVPVLKQWETTRHSGLSHVRGTVSLARDLTGSGDALTDIVIFTADQTELDEGGSHGFDAKGFPAFGRVVAGIDVADRIVARAHNGKSAVPLLAGQVLSAPVRIERAVRRSERPQETRE